MLTGSSGDWLARIANPSSLQTWLGVDDRDNRDQYDKYNSLHLQMFDSNRTLVLLKIQRVKK
jgi:hypothetical protein